MKFSLFFRVASKVNDCTITKDLINISIKAGTGGNGILRYNGIGGDGGYFYARANNKVTFDEFYYKFKEVCELRAEHGQHSRQVKLVGKSGKDFVFDVPLGVEITNHEAKLMARCVKNRQRYLLARGGKGGCAENKYKGQPGEHFDIKLFMPS